MTPRSLAAGLLGVLLALLFPILPVLGQEPAVLPSETYSSIRSSESVPVQQMAPVDSDALREDFRARDDRVGPYAYGTAPETHLTSDHHGVWESLPSGDWLWRLRLQSDEAVSLSVGFTRFQLPDGAEVYLHGPDNADIRGPYTAADATNGQHWTPLVHGDQLTIELHVPEGQRPAVQLEIGRVVHGVRSISPTVDRGPPSKSGACNVDVACDEADPWRKQARSVGLYTFVQNGSTFACSGALVNNTANDKTPYFLTAEHCVTSPEVASTMVFYWNYQNETCRTRGSTENGKVTDDSLTAQTSSGALLRVRQGNYHSESVITGKSDLALVEIDDDLPEEYNLYLSGWSRAEDPTTEGVSIHHPSGHGKRISFDDDSTSITAYGQVDGGTTHLRIGDWDLGTTEAGSSGAPLFNTDHHVVGVLSGGRAGCKFGSAEDNDLPDWYGRVTPGFEEGDYKGHTLADWLDPLDTGTDTLGGIPQSERVDLIAPASPRNLRISRVNTGGRDVTLRWTATGDDHREGRASQYDLRYDTTPIQTKEAFQQAERVSNLPRPAEAGQPETVVVDDSDGLTQNRTYYFALVAVDEGGNRSTRAIPDRKAVLVRDIEIEAGGVTTGAGSSVSKTQFVLNETQDLRITLYDLLGRRIRVVFEDHVEEGFERSVRFQTNSLSSGTYFLRFIGQSFAATRKVVVVQ